MAVDGDSFRDRERSEKSSGSSCLFWTLGCAVVGVVMMFVCCGGIGYFGINLMTSEVQAELRDHPQIREHLGELSSVRLNLFKSMAHDGEDIWVYDLTGAKGKGEITIHHVTDESGDEAFHSATLRLSDGQTIQIQFDKKNAEAEAQPVNDAPMSDIAIPVPAEGVEAPQAASPATVPMP